MAFEVWEWLRIPALIVAVVLGFGAIWGMLEDANKWGRLHIVSAFACYALAFWLTEIKRKQTFWGFSAQQLKLFVVLLAVYAALVAANWTIIQLYRRQSPGVRWALQKWMRRLLRPVLVTVFAVSWVLFSLYAVWKYTAPN